VTSWINVIKEQERLNIARNTRIWTAEAVFCSQRRCYFSNDTWRQLGLSLWILQHVKLLIHYPTGKYSGCLRLIHFDVGNKTTETQRTLTKGAIIDVKPFNICTDVFFVSWEKKHRKYLYFTYKAGLLHLHEQQFDLWRISTQIERSHRVAPSRHPVLIISVSQPTYRNRQLVLKANRTELMAPLIYLLYVLCNYENLMNMQVSLQLTSVTVFTAVERHRDRSKETKLYKVCTKSNQALKIN
jgi:hypothetical protein